MSDDLKRNASVDFFKGICIIGVVIHHLGNRRLSVNVIDDISILVSFFSWSILGFIFSAAILHSHLVKNRTIFSVIYSRFQRLVIPYFALGFIYILIWFSMGLGGNDKIDDLILRLLSVQNPIGEQLYFLPLLFLAFLPWAWVSKMNANTKYFMFFLGLVLSFLIAFVFLFSSISFGRGITAFNVIVATLTYGLGIGYATLAEYHSGERLALSVLSFLLLGVVLLIATGSGGIAVSALAIGIFHVIRVSNLSFALLNKIGRASGWIYAYHTPFIIYPLLIISLKIGVPEWLCVLSTGAGSLFLAWGLGVFLKKFTWGKYVLA